MLGLAAQGMGGIIGLVAEPASIKAQEFGGGDGLLGVAVGEQDEEEGDKFALLTLVVRSEAQRRGVGRQLLRAIVNEVRGDCLHDAKYFDFSCMWMICLVLEGIHNFWTLGLLPRKLEFSCPVMPLNCWAAVDPTCFWNNHLN